MSFNEFIEEYKPAPYGQFWYRQIKLLNQQNNKGRLILIWPRVLNNQNKNCIIIKTPTPCQKNKQ